VKPELAVVIPTIGRSTLVRTLDALEAQLGAEMLEVLVVGDSYAGYHAADLEQARQHVLEERDERFRWFEYDGGLHMVGHPQRMAGARCATAPFVWYGQDDNIAADGAVPAILETIAGQPSARPIFGRWLSPWRELIWRDRHLQMGNIDADCLVLPRLIAERVQWGPRYEGDFDAAAHAASLSAGIDWLDFVISVARPDQEHLWWQHAPAEASA